MVELGKLLESKGTCAVNCMRTTQSPSSRLSAIDETCLDAEYLKKENYFSIINF